MTTNVFLIDDDQDEKFIFFSALSELAIDCKCTYAAGADQAYEMLKYLNVDYLFIDLNMPRKNGFECLTELKAKLELKNTCIVMYSNGLDEASCNKALKLGADLCLQKAASQDLLKKALLQILDSNCVAEKIIYTRNQV